MLRKILLLSVVVVTLATATSTTALAQMLCVERVDMLDRLASEYGEELIEVKMVEEHGLLEVLKSRTSGSWTVLLTRPGGISCVMATGRGAPDKKEYEL